MRNTPLRLRVLSVATALALISSCSLPAFAGQFYLEDGSITVVAGEDGNDVTQNDKTTYGDKDTTISNRDSSKATDNTVTIRADGDKTADVTLKDTNIEAKDSSAVRAEGTGTVEIELDGENKLTGGTDSDGKGYAGLEKKNNYTGGEVSEVGYKDGTLIIKDENNDGGSLIATGTGNSAGIGGSEDKAGDSSRADNAKCSHNIEIDGGDITANGSGGGAGIGGAENGFGKVTIKGGTINANGGTDGGAGIGGGKADGWSGLGEVTVSGGNITATGGVGAAGIGGGQGGDAHVTISGGNVTANGGGDAAAIGTGANTSYDNSYVKISGGEVEANGGSNGEEEDGSGIGGNNTEVKISGGKVTANGTGSAAAIRGNTVNISANDSNLELTVSSNQGELIEAKNDPDTILALGEEHSASAVFSSNANGGYGKRTHNNAKGHTWLVDDTNTDTSVTVYKCSCGEYYKVPKGNCEHSWNYGYVTKLPTYTEEGVRTYTCRICNATYTVPIAKLAHEHSWQVKERVEPTCIEEGYVLYFCSCGGEEREVLLPNGQHSWDAGVVTKEPTTESAGEKLYTCTVCGETYTETIPMLDSSSNSITAWYRVADGAQDYTQSCLPQIVGDTCTFAAELENAALSGNFAYLQQLYAQGVRTLCFVTANRTTKLSLEGLLARGDEESVFALAHTGANAALTVDGQAADQLLH